MNLYGMGVDTLLMCYLVDYELHKNEGGPKSAPPSLKEYVSEYEWYMYNSIIIPSNLQDQLQNLSTTLCPWIVHCTLIKILAILLGTFCMHIVNGQNIPYL